MKINMAEQELSKLIKLRRKQGVTVVRGNDSMNSGYVFFTSHIHSCVPSPISFEFIRLLENGEAIKVGFAMPFAEWKEIIKASISDL